MKIGVITPVSHMKSVVKNLASKGRVFYCESENKIETKNFLIDNSIDTILCNPNKQPYIIDEDFLSSTKVKLINTCSTGLNHIDVDFCNKNNIRILSLTKDFDLLENLPSTSELAFALMMTLLRKIPQSGEHVKSLGWDYTDYVGRQVKGLTVGIVGFGRLGKMMHRYCQAFEANCIVYDPYVKNIGCQNLKELAKKSDVVSLHVHVSEETKYMINDEFLSHLKPSSYVVNTSRGEIVDEKEIVKAIKSKKLAGYATDVIEHEFEDIKDSPIIQALLEGENVVVTPHTGGMTIEGQEKAYNWAVNKL